MSRVYIQTPAFRRARQSIATQRSRTTNKPHHLPNIKDGRSAWARRRKDLIQAFTAQCKPETCLEHTMVANAAAAQTRVEQLAVDVVNGDYIGVRKDAERVRLSNLVIRTLQFFNDRDRRKLDTPTQGDPAHVRAYLHGAQGDD